MGDTPDMPCENEFCLHYAANEPSMISDWNKTRCSMYEIDPFDANELREFPGFRTDTCAARQRYVKMWGEETRWAKKCLADGYQG